MKLAQLESLTEDELEMMLYIISVVNPPSSPKLDEWKPHNLTWFKHDALVKRLMDSFPRVLPEGHEIFVSMMQKIGIAVQIHKVPVPPPPPPNEASASATI